MRTKRLYSSAALIILALLSSACRHNPSTATTPYQRVAVANGVLAKSNLTVVSGVISLQKSGVVPAAQAKTILQFCDLIANSSEGIRIVMVTPGDWQSQAAQIQKILANVNVSRWLSVSKVVNPQVLALFEAVSSSIALISQEVNK